jgi:hypothetical protein
LTPRLKLCLVGQLRHLMRFYVREHYVLEAIAQAAERPVMA